MSLLIDIFLFNEDNFGFLLHDEKTGLTAAIDAGDDIATKAALKRRGWQLDEIFITHHDWDHTDGLLALKKEFGAKVTGPKAEKDKINGLDVLVSGGDIINFGSLNFQVIKTAGHTLGHISYFEPRGQHLFCGDALFSLGCGRMIEGNPKMMWQGLERIKQLPSDTLIYCGHEYSKSNAIFARHIDPNNEKLQARQKEIDTQLANSEFTIPTTLGAEKTSNPFLRCDEKIIAAKMGLSENEPIEVFAALRRSKDIF